MPYIEIVKKFIEVNMNKTKRLKKLKKQIKTQKARKVMRNRYLHKAKFTLIDAILEKLS